MVTARQRMTPAEYLAFERSSPTRHEYYSGEIWAMAGASLEHDAIFGAIFYALYGQLRGRPCQVFFGDMKVRPPVVETFMYPNISVVCGTPEFADDERDVLLNPTVIVEVLSPSTQDYDRNEKFDAYETMESLQEYILVAQDRLRVEHYLRHGKKWLLTVAHSRDVTLELPTINCTLALADVYEKVRFEE